MESEYRSYRQGRLDARSIMLDGYSHDSTRNAERAADQVGLGINYFSYTNILKQVETGQNPIEICAKITGTRYEEQLKALFATDASLDGRHRPNAVVAVVRYSDRVDYAKVKTTLASIKPLLGKEPVSSLKSGVSELSSLGIAPDHLGINPKPISVPAFFTPRQGESFDPYTDKIESRYVIDESIRSLTKFCMLVGYKTADSLVVIDGKNEQLGNRLDAFFKNYFDRSPFAIADIRKTE